MRHIFLSVLISVSIISTAAAVPSLQLFIDGATYDWGTQTWVTQSGGFDLYVVSAKTAKSDVIVSMALAQTDNRDNVDINFDGNAIHQSDWLWGYAPVGNEPDIWNGGEDLPRHGIFPTWYTQMHTGAYDFASAVGDVQPNSEGDYWNPATGLGVTTAFGQIKRFHVETGGTFSFIHFDAYTLNPDGSIDQFAPFSHDAETVSSVPEPGTLALLSTGLLGLGIYVRKRRHP
jgi:hypothetical protein